MIGSLLVPVDGSAYARSATELAIVLAKSYNARLTGLYVLDGRFLEMPPYLDYSQTFEGMPPTILPLEVLEQYRAKGERILAGFKETAEQAVAQVETRAEEGDPSQLIADIGNASDLIVMGKRGEYAKWGKDLLGSTAESVVRRAGTPVLLCESEIPELSQMLVLFDGSAPSFHALKLAADIAVHLSSEVKIFTVDDNEDNAKSIQVDARSYLEPLNLRTSYVTAPGRADRAAIALATQEPAGLVVAGMRGHSAMHDLILGSISEHIMRSLALPVLLVP